MNTKLIIGGIVVLVLVIGGYAWLSSRDNGPGMMMENGRDNDRSENGNDNDSMMSGRMSMRNMMTRSGSHRCTFSDASANTSGTVYISGGRMRGDFSVTSNGSTMASHMIAMDNKSYVWTDGMSQGFMMSIDEAQQQAPQGSNSSVDWNREIDYQCANWSEDSSLFNVPSDIQFMDMKAMMQGQMGL